MLVVYLSLKVACNMFSNFCTQDEENHSKKKNAV